MTNNDYQIIFFLCLASVIAWKCCGIIHLRRKKKADDFEERRKKPLKFAGGITGTYFSEDKSIEHVENKQTRQGNALEFYCWTIKHQSPIKFAGCTIDEMLKEYAEHLKDSQE